MPAEAIPRRQDWPFSLPSARLRRETRQDLAPPWVFTRELSAVVTPLRLLAGPLIRDRIPYAGVPSKRSASFPPP
jgi:hypothetical protein